jgi:hypothetical protein
VKPADGARFLATLALRRKQPHRDRAHSIRPSLRTRSPSPSAASGIRLPRTARDTTWAAAARRTKANPTAASRSTPSTAAATARRGLQLDLGRRIRLRLRRVRRLVP